MHRFAVATVTSISLLVGTTATAQPQRCVHFDAQGRCVLEGSTRLGGFGALPETGAAARPAAPNRAPAHQAYMSPTCASLSDGVRTASARGLGAQAQADLRADYQAACLDDEAAARQRLELERQRQQQARAEQRSQADERVRQGEARAHQAVAQCGEMRRILAGRHARIDTLSSGERADLRRFEVAFAERCPPPPALP